MAYDDWESEGIFAECPSCGSDNVIIEVSDGFFFVVKCKDCGYKAF